MRVVYHIALLAVLLFLQSCGKAGAYNRQAKTIDSLSGAINAMVRELQQVDTIVLQKAVARFNDYRQFIKQHLTDTIEKTEADNLQHFYAGGNCVSHFSANRRALLARAALINSQLAKLSEDIKQRSAEPEVLTGALAFEKNEATKLMEAGYDQQKKFHSGFEEFRNSLNGVEALLRSRNRGELPAIIKDTVNL